MLLPLLHQVVFSLFFLTQVLTLTLRHRRSCLLKPSPACNPSPHSGPSHPLTAVCRDRPADGRPGGHGGALHPAPGRSAEGGAAGGAHRGRLRPGEQDGEGLTGHPQGHRLHRLPLHPLSVDRRGQMLLCEEGARDVCLDVCGGGEEMLYVPTKDADVYMKK